MNALLVASGQIKEYELLKSVSDSVDFIICADGGLDHLLKLKLKPNMVFGDLDSISREGLDFINKENIPIKRFSSIKDASDSELCLDYLVASGYKEVTLMGVTGGRQDHSLANIFLLNYLLENGVRGKILDDKNIIYLVKDYLKVKARENYNTSILPLGLEGATVSLKGFSYKLNRTRIDFASSLGLSNEIMDKYGEITVHQGRVLVFQSKD